MKTFIALAIALLLSACANQRVSTDFEPDTNFNQYRTWNWVEVSATTEDSPYAIDGLMDNRIRRAIQRELTARGMEQVSGNADVMINYLTKVETKIDVDTFYSHFGYHPYYHGHPYHFGPGLHADTRVRTYKEGTLMVDVVDSQSRQLLWRGSITDTLKRRQTPQERTQDINQAVAAILAQFPRQSPSR